MVLRKPYAFLIKHFRLIHLIITVLFGLVALKCRNIYMFLKKVIEASTNRYDAPMYINYGIFVYILLALVLCFLVQWLLKYKDKPRRLYKFTIGIYFIIIIFMFILFGYMGGFANAVAEQKTIRLYRDILTITLLFQYYTVFVMLIRGLGFDIKKFDFNRDMQELNAEAGDSEEVEVNVGIDTTNVMRVARKGQRELTYFFKEFKVYIVVILAVIVAFLGYKGFIFVKTKYKVYSVDEPFGYNNIMTIKDGYYASYGNKKYVIINFNIYKYGAKEQFNTGNLTLHVGRKKYSVDKNICYRFNDLGNCYKKQYVTENESNYILAYEVDELKNNQVYVVYNDYYDNNYKVKIYLKGE